MSNDLTKQIFQSLINLMMDIEFSSDDYIDPDYAVMISENVIFQLQHLKTDETEIITNFLNEFADKEKNKDRKNYLECFAENAGFCMR